ncbi:MAG: rRNA maturation RNase YbeY [Elusimicrobia bacterium RIFOXYA12_FULL_51_18]|nr:MAG: rRNA maturation RNase YbeY [Elusimicrobia bacterium RIFOXYA12_FULL_51_18]OGS30779.1 MAG: rRNA maturation RNase YbeY [Elusimicrobia bacterium RIFOXYA2_FULL_53_38]
MTTVTVFFNTRSSPSVKELGPMLRKAVRNATIKNKGGINLVLVADTEIKRLNRAFLSRTGATDVIAFNHPKPILIPPGENPTFGDIFICLPVARRQAKKMGHSLGTELLILATHGALHLSGMDDATPTLRRKMNIETVRLLKKLL